MTDVYMSLQTGPVVQHRRQQLVPRGRRKL